jgi:hypothetical protein
MPAEAKPRWITVRKPFDYRWPGRTAMTSYSENDLGEHLVKAEVADYATEKGYATEGKLDGSARSRKTRKRSKPARKKDADTAKTADTRSADSVGVKDVSAAGRSADGSAVDSHAG